MSWESCVVLLNSDSTNNFYTGDIVTGTVVIELKQKQRVERKQFESAKLYNTLLWQGNFQAIYITYICFRYGF